MREAVSASCRYRKVKKPRSCRRRHAWGRALAPRSRRAIPLARAARPHGGRLAEEDGAVSVGDLHAGVEGGGDVDQRLQQLEALAVREEPLAAEVLDGAQPVDAGGQPLETRHHAPHVLSRPEVEHLFLRAERAQLRVDALLDPGNGGERRHDQDRETVSHWKSRERKTRSPSPRAKAP